MAGCVTRQTSLPRSAVIWLQQENGHLDSKVGLGWGGGWVVTGQVQGHLGTWHGISRGLTGVSTAQQDRAEPQVMETPPKCGVPEGC